MREARRTAEGRWYMVEGEEEVCRIGRADWRPDAQGHWPRLDLEARALNETVQCPACGTAWVLEEFDCVFGTARRAGNDLLVLVRCTSCRLPHRLRGVGFVTAYPRTTELMEGWAGWEKRRSRFREEEENLYGEAVPE
jgi:hypothetical protein